MDFFEANQFALIDCTALPESVVFKETVSPSTVTGKWMTDADGIVTTRRNNAARELVFCELRHRPTPNPFHTITAAAPPIGPQIQAGSVWINSNTNTTYLCRGFYNGVPSWLPMEDFELHEIRHSTR